MRVDIVRIGNSRGIRIPKKVLDHYRIGQSADLEFLKDHLALRPVRRPREGWHRTFHDMAARGDDRLLDNEALRETRWEHEEWEW